MNHKSKYLPHNLLKHLFIWRRLKGGQKALFWVGVIALLIITVPIVFESLLHAGRAQADWYNNNWLYRQTAQVTNNGSAQTDFQVAITLNTSSLISAGKMKSDCSDIRLTDPNGVALPYWIENGANACNTTSTAIWTKIPSIPAGSSYIYVYYGNPSAQSVANGHKVFQFFDDFSGDLSQWVNPSGCAATISGGALQISSSLGCDQTPMYEKTLPLSDTNGYIVDFRGKFASGGSGRLEPYQRYIAASGNSARFWTSGTSTNYQEYISGSFGGNTNVGNSGMSADTYANISIQVNGTNNTFSVNGTTIGSATTSDSSLKSQSNLVVGLGEYNTAVTYDDVRIRKYAATMPTAGTPTNEEQAPGPVAYWKFDEGTGTTVHDSTQQHNDGTLSGTTKPTWQSKDQCVSGKCLYFDGSTSYLDYSPQISKVSSLSTGTITGWFKVNALNNPNTDGKQSIFNFSQGANTIQNLLIMDVVSDGSIRIVIRPNSGTSIDASTAGGVIKENTWYHISFAVSYSGNKLYLNGVPQTLSYTNGSASTQAFLNTPSSPTYFWLGASKWNAAFQRPFGGFLDDFKIYSYARSANQIQTDYLGGLKGSGAVLGAATNQNLSNGLIGYWKMDEASWTNNCSTKSVIDSSGNGKNGKSCPNSTGSTGGGVGKFGNGGVFDGSNDYVQIDSPGLPTKDFTYSFWEKSTYNGSQFLMASNGSGVNEVWLKENSGSLQFQLHNDTPISTTTNVYDGVWHQITVTRSGSDMRMYVDGDLKASGTDGTTLSFSTCPLMIGVDVDSGCTGSLGQYMNGTMDELRMYNRALSPNEVQQLYTFAPGPIAYYNFNENQGSSVNDISGNNNTGTWNGTGTHWSRGKIGSAGSFNGSDDSITVSDSSSLDGTSGVSVEAWVNAKSIPSGTWPGIVSKTSDSTNLTNGYGIRQQNGTSTLQPWVGNGTTGSYNSTSLTLPLNSWHHIAMTYQSGAGGVIYLDGVKVGTLSNVGNISPTSSSITIGSQSTAFFKGDIDDVRIYNYARTQKQIIQDMQSNSSVIASGAKQSALAYWKFDEGTGTTTRNVGSAGSTINGTITNATWTNSGKFGRALSFNGSSAYVSGSDTPLPSGTSPSTQTLWFKANSTCSNSVLFVYGTGTTNQARGITCNNATSIKLFGWGNDFSFTVPTIGTTWHYIASVFDGSTVALYYDGKYIGSQATSWNTVLSGTWDIGKNFSTVDYFNGTIDEVKVYPYTLTASEVALDYNHGSALSLGNSGTDSSGNPSNAADSKFCPPGDTTTTCSPVGQWDFKENQGTTVSDVSGNNNSGTWNGTGSHWTRGKVGNGGNFNGSNDYVTISDSSSLDPTSALTLEAWVKFNTIDSAYHTIAGKWYVGVKQQYLLQIDTNNKLAFWTGNGGSGGDVVESNLTPIAGKWYHVVGVLSGANKYLYINGVLDNSGTTAYHPLGTANTPFTIGSKWNSSASYFEFFNGQIDQVRLYNYARSSAEVAYDYNGGKPIAQYKFDECQGATVHDASGNNNNGTITIGSGGSQTAVGTCQTSSTAWGNGTTGKLGHSLSFDGTDDYVDASPLSSLTTNFTVSMWVYPTKQNTWQTLYASGTATNFWRINIDGSGNRLSFTKDSVADYFATSAVNFNQWNHLVVVKNGDSGTNVTFYMNGRAIGTASVGSVVTPSGTAYLGASDTSGGNFSGRLDDVRLYNYPLTPQQIKTLYNNGAVSYGQ